MKIKASGRPALILATGLFVCFAGPSQAAPSADDAAASAKSEDAAGASVASKKSAKHGSRHWKSHADRKSGKVAVKSDTDKTDATEVADKNSESSWTSPAIPSWVANANARLAFADAPTGERGILAVTGPTLSPGYVDERLSSELFVRNMPDGRVWASTGDLGTVDADGYIWVYGREKDLIIRAGGNIDPKLIEEVLAQLAQLEARFRYFRGFCIA